MNRKIALISEHASPLVTPGGTDSGGQNVYVGQVARHLAEYGYRVDIFTRRDTNHLPDVVSLASGVRVIHIAAGPAAFVRKEELLPYMGDFAAAMQRFCQQQQQPYDLIHANFWMSALVADWLRQRLGTPFVVTFHALGRVRQLHQGAADESPAERIALEEQVVAQADAIIAECPQDYADLVRLYQADPSRLSVIPCGFDPAEFCPVPQAAARSLLGLAQDERIVLQLGRMVPRKGVATVIRGFARFARQHAGSARLLIVGGASEVPDPAATPEIGRLQQIAGNEGVAEYVSFLGRRNRSILKAIYSAADVFVTLPWYEPFGITPLEAMACGIPVIGSDVGGIKFSVRDGTTGYLIPPHDPAALTDRLAYLHAHPLLKQQFGRQALQRVRQSFTWRHVTGSIAALYEQVLAGKQPLRLHGSTETVPVARVDNQSVALLNI